MLSVAAEGIAVAGVPVPPGAGPLPDRREGGTRHRSVLLIGRVCGGPGAPACLVHDVSRNGMMARFVDPPAVGDVLVIEVRGLPPVAGTVRWVRGQKAGIQFAEPQPVESVFALHRPDGTVARAPRFPVALPARLRIDGRRLAVTLVDLSAGGAKLAVAAGAVARAETGAIEVAGETLFGTLCWTDGDRAGFRFAIPLPLTALTRLVAG